MKTVESDRIDHRASHHAGESIHEGRLREAILHQKERKAPQETLFFEIKSGA